MAVSLGILTLGNVPLLLWIWVARCDAPRGNGLRYMIGWVSLITATAANLIFWGGGLSFHPDVQSAAFDLWLKSWTKLCVYVSAAALLIALAGKGKHQWAVPISALITPLSCVLLAAMR